MSGHKKRLIACFQVFVRFAFSNHKVALFSTRIKQQKAPPFWSGLACLLVMASNAVAFSIQKKKRQIMSRISIEFTQTAHFPAQSFQGGNSFCSSPPALAAGGYFIVEGIIMYGPELTEFGSVSVRRLAWAIGTNMAEAVDFMALYLPQKMDMSFVCTRCKDKSKCGACGFLKTTNPALITTVK